MGLHSRGSDSAGPIGVCFDHAKLRLISSRCLKALGENTAAFEVSRWAEGFINTRISGSCSNLALRTLLKTFNSVCVGIRRKRPLYMVVESPAN